MSKACPTSETSVTKSFSRPRHAIGVLNSIGTGKHPVPGASSCRFTVAILDAFHYRHRANDCSDGETFWIVMTQEIARVDRLLARHAVEQIMAADYVRCVRTVQPLGNAVGVKVVKAPLFSEDGYPGRVVGEIERFVAT